MRVLLLEPYLTGSHAQWVEGYRRSSRHQIVPVVHEGRFWKWRMTGGYVTLAADARRELDRSGSPDVVLAVGTLHLAGLLGLLRDRLSGVPAALYLHENQVTYPASGRTRREEHLGLITWSSLVAADAVACNSEFHRRSLCAALPGFLGAFPDLRHHHLLPEVEAKLSVLPVGIDLRRLDPVPGSRGAPPLVLWNHRWDRDKDPGTFLDALVQLAGDGVEFRVVLAGERFGLQPEQWQPVVTDLGDRVVAAGHLDADSYRAALRNADVVVSTARQEFFGVSVVEAVYAGAFPVLPRRLVYPERIPPQWHDHCLYRGRRGLLERLRWALDHVEAARRVAASLRPAMADFDWMVVAPRYDDWLEHVAAVGAGAPSG